MLFYLLLLLERMECGKIGVILAHRFQGVLFQEKGVLMSHFPRQAVSSMLHSAIQLSSRLFVRDLFKEL